MSEENKNLNTISEETASADSNAVAETADKTEDTKAKKAKNKKSKPQKEKGKFKKFMKSRKAKHGTVAMAITALVIVMVIVLNIIIGLLVNRFPDLELDLTSNNSFALQDDTIDYVSHLNNDVTVYILMEKDTFESQGTYFVQAQKMLNKMVSKSNGKMKVKYVDLTSNPSFTSDYPNVDWQSSSANNIVLVESGKQYKVLTLADCFEYDEQTYNYNGSYSFTGTKIEQAVITAILNVTTNDKVVVDMIKGNNEQDYSSLKTLLENNAYQVNEVSLATGDFDKDAKVAIMYAPSVDLDEKIVEKLSTWLSNDGKYGRSLIYVPTADMGEMPNLDDFLKEWGMSIDRGYVFETDESTLVSASSPYAFTVSYGDYYKDNLKNSKIPVVVSESHAVNITDENTAHALLKTTDKAGVLPIDADKSWDYKDAITGNGENVAAEGVMTNEDKKSSRVVVFGSYIMFSDTIMKYNSFNNSAYFMNVINTIADKEDVGITIESKSIDNTELGITDVATQNTMLVVFVIVIPIAILVAGFVFWLRRRNR
ncbi:GldG family protein [Ruminococcus bromii]|uniref:GldG family protein n=1 Tax=Ruminococcus bromii TaxID=40518 RepID=UPI0026EA2394|nr:GldG family protein [Ruminococcus bromii]